MKKKLLRCFIFVLAIVLCTTTAKAGMWDNFWAAVTSRGFNPYIRTFYLIPHETLEGVDYLEFQEYSNSLKARLKELGYVETNKEDAALHIKLGYYFGQKETVSTTSSSKTYSVSNISLNINSAKTTSSKISGPTFSHGGGSTTTQTENGTPCYLRIEAIDVKSNNPQWTIDMEVIIDNLSRFPNIFPWMCLISKWYIGNSFSGKVCIANTKKKCYRIYNLPQHFDSDYWSLQYHYFGNSDVYIKKDPMPLVVK